MIGEQRKGDFHFQLSEKDDLMVEKLIDYIVKRYQLKLCSFQLPYSFRTINHSPVRFGHITSPMISFYKYASLLDSPRQSPSLWTVALIPCLFSSCRRIFTVSRRMIGPNFYLVLRTDKPTRGSNQKWLIDIQQSMFSGLRISQSFTASLQSPNEKKILLN